jgi:alanine racemase
LRIFVVMLPIKEIVKDLNPKTLLVSEDTNIQYVLTDSRKLINPQDTLFFAINGFRLDGHNYIEELYENGLRNFVVEKEISQKDFPEANIIVVKNTVIALQKVVSIHRSKFDIPVIGITGSNGKTIVKEWIHQLLHEDFQTVRSPKSFNSQVGVPLSVWSMEEKHSLAIFEAGISEPNEMENIEKVIQPTIGIFTNIGSAHGQSFLNDTHKTKEKLKLFLKSKVLIYCKDHTAINQSIADFWAHTINEDVEKPIFFSWSKYVDADIQIINKEKEFNKTIFTCIYLGKEEKFTIPFTDSSSLENAMHCIALMLYLKFDVVKINKKLNMLKRIEMRLEQKKGVNNCIVINDSYNSDIDSIKIALAFLVQQEQTQKRTVILSDILQSGMPAIDLYTAVDEMLDGSEIDRFIGVGKNVSHFKYLFNKNETIKETSFYLTTEDFLSEEQDSNFNSEAILLKGARSFHFEKISTFLEEKIHATVFEVNLNAIIHNLKYFTGRLKANTKVMVMVKAFAYGAGSYEIAKLLEFHRVDYLGVAYADEGITLRKAGIDLPIMVLNPEVRSFDAMVRYQLEPEIYSIDLLKQFAEKIDLLDLKKPFPIHINVDTGMKRFGFDFDELEEVLKILSKNKQLTVASMFSHLAASDEDQWKIFTEGQIEKFNKAFQVLCDSLPNTPIKHLLNSSGIIRYPDAQFDMVRLGLGLYGINSDKQKDLVPVGTFKTTISQIRKIKKGETVGYGRVGKMEKDGFIAVIAVGYSDGFSRALSNGKGNVFIHGQKCKVLGNICMDMSMIDISNLKGAKVGDEVEVFGSNISVAEIADQIGSITYEVLTMVSERVKRVFFVE